MDISEIGCNTVDVAEERFTYHLPVRILKDNNEGYKYRLFSEEKSCLLSVSVLELAQSTGM
jgi:hypothetical protein